MKKYQCIVCGWIYDEAEGWPQDGIVAGTLWEDIPDDLDLPRCGVSKADFEMIESKTTKRPCPMVFFLTPTSMPSFGVHLMHPIVIIGSGMAGYTVARPSFVS